MNYCQPGYAKPWEKGEYIWIDEYQNSLLASFVNDIDEGIEIVSVIELDDEYLTIEITKEISLKVCLERVNFLLGFK